MSWQKLLANNVVTKLAPTKVEMDNLRRVVTRSLNDVNAKGLSDDARSIMAYDAARTLSAMIVRAAIGSMPDGQTYASGSCTTSREISWLALIAELIGSRHG